MRSKAPGVILIGPSDAGKTTNLIVSYGTLSTGSSEYIGMGIRFYDPDLELLYGRFTMDAKDPGITDGIKAKDYPIYLNGIFRKHHLMDIRIMDTVGGFTDMDASDDIRYKLDAALDKADYILVYVPCTELIPDDDADLQLKKARLDHLLSIINSRIQRNIDSTDVIFVISKIDKFNEDPLKAAEAEAVFSKLRDQADGVRFHVFTISSMVGRKKGPELPLVAVMTSILLKGLHREKKRPHFHICKRGELRCVRFLVEKLSNETGDGRWIDMMEQLRRRWDIP